MLGLGVHRDKQLEMCAKCPGAPYGLFSIGKFVLKTVDNAAYAYVL